MCRAASNIFVLIMFPLLSDKLQYVYFCFLLLSVGCLIIASIYLIETKGKSLVEIENVMIHKVSKVELIGDCLVYWSFFALLLLLLVVLARVD